MMKLEYEPHGVPAELRQLGVRRLAQFELFVPKLPVRGHVQTAQVVQQGRLAAPGRAEKHDQFPGIKLQIHSCQRADRRLSAPIDLRDSPHSEHPRARVHWR